MEDTLREIQKPIRPKNQGLNPCSNGRYSQRYYSSSRYDSYTLVLILVLMEDTLRVISRQNQVVSGQS